jgi:ribonuclease P protein component
LTAPEEYGSVLAFRRSFSAAHVQLLYRPNGRKAARLGLIVARKLARKAVTRNCIKRVAREAFRSAKLGLPPYDMVFRLIRATERADRGLLRAEMDLLLAKLAR